MCGNQVIEAGEQCDGTAHSPCVGVCGSDCTCPPPVCGNDVIEAGEDCDGTRLGVCAGLLVEIVVVRGYLLAIGLQMASRKNTALSTGLVAALGLGLRDVPGALPAWQVVQHGPAATEAWQSLALGAAATSFKYFSSTARHDFWAVLGADWEKSKGGSGGEALPTTPILYTLYCTASELQSHAPLLPLAVAFGWGRAFLAASAAHEVLGRSVVIMNRGSMTFTVRPLTPDLWPALEDLFGKGGASNGCWCMYWRLGPEYHKRPREKNRSALRSIVQHGRPEELWSDEQLVLQHPRAS